MLGYNSGMDGAGVRCQMSEKTGGLPMMRGCHTTPPQRVDLALDRRLRNWWLRTRSGNSHHQIHKMATPPPGAPF